MPSASLRAFSGSPVASPSVSRHSSTASNVVGDESVSTLTPASFSVFVMEPS